MIRATAIVVLLCATSFAQEQLSADDWLERVRTYQAGLDQLDPWAPQVLIGLCSHLGTLGRSGHADTAVPPLIELLRDRHAAVRARAATMLDSMGPAASPALDALVSLCRTEVETAVLERAGRALASIDAPRARAAILPRLQDARPRARRNAARVLAYLDDSSGVETALQDALRDTDPDVRRAAAYSLRGIGTAASLRPLAWAYTLESKGGLRYQIKAAVDRIVSDEVAAKRPPGPAYLLIMWAQHLLLMFVMLTLWFLFVARSCRVPPANRREALVRLSSAALPPMAGWVLAVWFLSRQGQTTLASLRTPLQVVPVPAFALLTGLGLCLLLAFASTRGRRDEPQA